MTDTGEQAFETVAGLIDYPMYVVTAGAGNDLSGCLVGFTTQTSLDPLRFLVCVSQANHTHAIAAAADHIAVHLLGADQHELARLFGARSEDTIDKFTRCRWRVGPHGLPILADVPAWFTGRVVDRVPLGDHTGLLLAPDQGAALTDPAAPLMFQQVDDIEPSHPG